MATAYPSTAYTLYKMDKLILEKVHDKKELDEYIPSFLEEGRLTENMVNYISIAKSSNLVCKCPFYKQFLNEYNSSDPPVQLTEKCSTFEGSTNVKLIIAGLCKDSDIPNDGKALFGCDAVSNLGLLLTGS